MTIENLLAEANLATLIGLAVAFLSLVSRRGGPSLGIKGARLAQMRIRQSE
ncbi:MAG: hypothetical protein V2I76_06445 [Roseobacter sp.]|jgi:hypothetical protein|nr:hypothetical protein [Roseobacter sp.]